MTPGIGGRTVSRILARNELLGRTPEDFLKLPVESLREEYRIGVRPATALIDHKPELFEALELLERRLDVLGVTLVTTADAAYPNMIEEMDPDPPGVLFLYGNQRLLASRTFSVLASRNSRPGELDLIEQWAEEGILNSEVLVTGHDRPEYQRSAVVPLRWGSPRILCLDRGLFKVLGPDLRDEAFRTARLWRYEFDPKTDLVISPFRPESDFIGVNNKVRDKLIASLSLRMRFASINEGGNMEKLAKMGLKAGRKVEVSDRCLQYRQFRELGASIIS